MSAWVRGSSRCARALAIAVAARDANSTRTFSSSSVKDLPARLLAEEEVADTHPPVPDRHGLEGLRERQLLGIAERAEVGGQIREPQRARKVPEVFEELVAVRPFRHVPALVRRQAGGDELLDRAGVVDGRDHAVAGAGQGAGAIHHLAEDGVEVEAGVDAQNRRVEQRDALGQRLVFPSEFVVGTHMPPLIGIPGRVYRVVHGMATKNLSWPFKVHECCG